MCLKFVASRPCAVWIATRLVATWVLLLTTKFWEICTKPWAVMIVAFFVDMLWLRVKLMEGGKVPLSTMAQAHTAWCILFCGAATGGKNTNSVKHLEHPKHCSRNNQQRALSKRRLADFVQPKVADRAHGREGRCTTTVFERRAHNGYGTRSTITPPPAAAIGEDRRSRPLTLLDGRGHTPTRQCARACATSARADAGLFARGRDLKIR